MADVSRQCRAHGLKQRRWAASNQIRWEYTATDFISSSPALGPDDTIYFGSWDRNVYAINPDGSQKWSFATGDYVTSWPGIGPGGTVHVGSWDKHLYALQAPASGITATLTCQYETGSYVKASPTVSGTTVYMGSWDTCLYALTAPVSGLTATVVFSYTMGTNVVGWATIMADGTMYFSPYDKTLYALNPNGTLYMRSYDQRAVRSQRVRMGGACSKAALSGHHAAGARP